MATFCVFCGKTIKGSFPRHLRDLHRLNDRAITVYKDDIKMLGRDPDQLYKIPLRKQTLIKICCPVPGCSRQVKQLGHHLKSGVHNFKQNEERYKTMMAEGKKEEYRIRYEAEEENDGDQVMENNENVQNIEVIENEGSVQNDEVIENGGSVQGNQVIADGEDAQDNHEMEIAEYAQDDQVLDEDENLQNEQVITDNESAQETDDERRKAEESDQGESAQAGQSGQNDQALNNSVDENDHAVAGPSHGQKYGGNYHMLLVEYSDTGEDSDVDEGNPPLVEIPDQMKLKSKSKLPDDINLELSRVFANEIKKKKIVLDDVRDKLAANPDLLQRLRKFYGKVDKVLYKKCTDRIRCFYRKK